MHFSTFIAPLLALAGLAAAAPAPAPAPAGPEPASRGPWAVVYNYCSTTAYLWAVGGSISGPYTLPANGGSYYEYLYKDPVSGGRALKLTKTSNGLYDGSPQTIFAYNLDGNKVWYDLSDVNGDAWSGSRLRVKPSISSCPVIEWPNGVSPGGSQVKVCDATTLVFTLCAS